MRVKDAFEIKAEYAAGHEPGLVVVLDQRLCDEPACLAGRTASIRTPAGKEIQLRVENAKDHGGATSLFFRNLMLQAIPVGSEISVPAESSVAPKASPLAS